MSDATRSGNVAANSVDVSQPSHIPKSVAFADPTASSTISRSRSIVSCVGASRKRSERPEPRRSMRISRDVSASWERNLDSEGYSHAYSRFDTNPDTTSRSRAPSPTT